MEAIWLYTQDPVFWWESLETSLLLALVSSSFCSKACICVDLQDFAFIQAKLVKTVTT